MTVTRGGGGRSSGQIDVIGTVSRCPFSFLFRKKKLTRAVPPSGEPPNTKREQLPRPSRVALGSKKSRFSRVLLQSYSTLPSREANGHRKSARVEKRKG